MKQTKRFFGLIAAALLATSTWAQMKFTYSAQATESELADGSRLVQLASGTNLNEGFITGATVGGQAVDLSDINPNPATTFITDGEIETFVYDGKAYSFRFTEGQYFTAVMFGDPHVDQGNGYTTTATMQEMVTNICKLGQDGGQTVTFSKAPKGYTATADIVFCLGDMDKDSQSDKTVFNNAMQGFNDASIPFITIAGNHDFVPDYWTGNEGTAGLSGGITGGAACNDVALDIVTAQYGEAAGFGGFTVETIKDQALTDAIHPGHFTFKYRGVRFYCANNYWFQKPYKMNSLLGAYTSLDCYYAADGTINALSEKVESNGNEAAIWLSHYPFVSEANSGTDASARWWLDQTDVARTIKPTDAATSEYYNGDAEIPAYTTEEGKALATKKKKALADIIVKTKNPVHFSGHSHLTQEYSYSATDGTSFKDYTIATPRAAYVVLCKEGVGVVEVKTVTF